MNRFHWAARTVSALIIALTATTWATAQQGSGFKFLEVKVIDPEGKPVADAEVTIKLAGATFPMPTDERGMISLNVPAGGDSATSLVVKREGYVNAGVTWNVGETVPEELTIALSTGIAIGGIVHDRQGNPVEGVKVEGLVVATGADDPPGNGQVVPMLSGEIATTDAEGRWRTSTAPEQPKDLALEFTHPDFLPHRGYGHRDGMWEQLRSLEHDVVLQKGIELHGTVVDPDGRPVVGAKVATASRFMSDRQVVETDAEGRYRLTKLAAGATLLTVTSPDWAPDTRTVTASLDAEPANFQLGPPNTVRLKVVDPDGMPIEGVTVMPEVWRGHQALEDPLGRRKTDAEGIWEWHAAPPDEIQYSIFKDGRFGVPPWQATFTASDEIQEVTMLPAPIVNGTVVDKKTGQPIEKFRYVEGVWWEPQYDGPTLQAHNVQVSQDGKFRFAMESGCVKFMMRVEADGYRAVESREILPEEREVDLAFEMEAGAGPTGVVKLPNGKPAEGIKVAMATAKQQVGVYNGELETDFAAGHAVTDAEGSFEMPFPEGDFAIVCVGDAGWAVAYANQNATSVEATLEPWGGLVGVAVRGTEPLSGEEISLSRVQSYDVNAPRVYFQNHTKTDDNGRFSFEWLQAGPATVSRRVRYADRGSSWMSAETHTVNLNILPSKTFAVQLGGMGRNVAGQLTVPADFADELAWHMGSVSLVESREPLGVEGFFYRMGLVIGQAASGNLASPAPRQQETPPTYSAAIADDGRYEIFDVPAGGYQLRVTLYPKMTGNDSNWNAIGSLNVRVTVPEAADGQTEPVDLGSHELKVTAP